MQISSSSSALSKISRAVFGDKYIDTVEYSIFLSLSRKKTYRKIQIQTSSSTMTKTARQPEMEQVACIVITYFLFAHVN